MLDAHLHVIGNGEETRDIDGERKHTECITGIKGLSLMVIAFIDKLKDCLRRQTVCQRAHI